MKRSNTFDSPSPLREAELQNCSEQQQINSNLNFMHMQDFPNGSSPQASVESPYCFPKRISVNEHQLNDPTPHFLTAYRTEDADDHFDSEPLLRNITYVNQHFKHQKDSMFTDTGQIKFPDRNMCTEPMQQMWINNQEVDISEAEVVKQSFDGRVKDQQYSAMNHNQSAFVKRELLDDQISHYINYMEMKDKGSVNLGITLAKIENIEEQDYNNPQRVNESIKKRSIGQETLWKEQKQVQSEKGQPVSLRKQKVLHYLEKKECRNFSKKITYQCRKEVADRRIRWRGRFINYKQAVSELNLNPNHQYDISYLKSQIKSLEEAGNITARHEKFVLKHEESHRKSCKSQDIEP